IAPITLVAQPDSEITDHHIMGFNLERAVPEGNPVAGSRLPRNGEIWIIDIKILLKDNRPRNFKYYCTGTFLFNSCPQTARTAVIEIRNINHFSGTPCFGIRTKSLRTREGFDLLTFHLSLFQGISITAFCSRESGLLGIDRKSTRLNSSHVSISYAVFCLNKKS